MSSDLLKSWERDQRYYEERMYTCPFCKHQFKRIVTSVGGTIDKLGNQMAKVSTKVKCEVCPAFLKTWE